MKRVVGALALTVALFCTSCGGDDHGDSAAAATTPVTSAPTSATASTSTTALSDECAAGVEASIGAIRSALDRVDDAPAGTVSVEDEAQEILVNTLNDGFAITGCENSASQRPPYTAVVAYLIQEETQRLGPSKEVVSVLVETFCNGEDAGDLDNEGREACAARG